ncbi:MAG: NAD-dependent epimerase/dehydratase family protein [Clostridia bacterium]|nr:NAD-dependent epimerase/dehydratase family protein [Clostridia bacterium]
MKVLIAGAKSFLGRNLVAELRNHGYSDLVFCEQDISDAELEALTKDCGFVFHLAGAEAGIGESDKIANTLVFTEKLAGFLEKSELEEKPKLLLASSVQAAVKTPFGKKKQAIEEIVENYGKNSGAETFVFRLPKLFGKWADVEEEGSVASYFHKIANDISVIVQNPAQELVLGYIDDVMDMFIDAIDGKLENDNNGRYSLEITHRITFGVLIELLRTFKQMRKSGVISTGGNAKSYWLKVPNMGDLLVKRLYSTYLSYLPEKDFACRLMTNTDKRGSVTDFIRTDDRGQITIDVTLPGETRGSHWHHTKTERYLVVSGEAVIKLSRVFDDDGNEGSKVVEYHVNSEKLTAVDIPPGYAHSIKNTGDSNLVTLIWCNEIFDPGRPDGYYKEV